MSRFFFLRGGVKKHWYHALFYLFIFNTHKSKLHVRTHRMVYSEEGKWTTFFRRGSYGIGPTKLMVMRRWFQYRKRMVSLTHHLSLFFVIRKQLKIGHQTSIFNIHLKRNFSGLWNNFSLERLLMYLSTQMKLSISYQEFDTSD